MPPPEFNPVRDVISGLIMAATSVPQLVAYAETAGYASHRGLSSAGPSLAVWGLATGSPYMNSGVTSVTALMANADLDGESYRLEYGEESYVYLISAYSICIGLASIVLALLGFGKLAQNVPKTVRSGFKWGCAVGVLASALPNGLLASGSSQLKMALSKSAPLVSSLQQSVKQSAPAATGFVGVTNVLYAMSNPTIWSPMSAAIFVACTVFVTMGPAVLPKFLPPGSEVIIATAAATVISSHVGYDGGTVGEIPQLDPNSGFTLVLPNGLCTVRVPVELLDLRKLATSPISLRLGGIPTLALSSALFAAVNFLSIVGIASGFESEDNIPWSAERELIAQGLACIMAGLTGSAPVSGSMSRSLVSKMTGTTSRLACIVTALVWIYCLPYMSVMSLTPKAALSAVIVSAVAGSVVRPKDLMRLRGSDAVVGWGTAIGTALTSPTIGFGFGFVLVVIVGVITGGKEKRQKKNKQE